MHHDWSNYLIWLNVFSVTVFKGIWQIKTGQVNYNIISNVIKVNDPLSMSVLCFISLFMNYPIDEKITVLTESKAYSQSSHKFNMQVIGKCPWTNVFIQPYDVKTTVKMRETIWLTQSENLRLCPWLNFFGKGKPQVHINTGDTSLIIQITWCGKNKGLIFKSCFGLCQTPT